MDSDSTISLSSPPPPPPPPRISDQEYSSPDSEVTPEPEDYDTASEPGVNDADSSAVARDTLSPEKNALTSSTETSDNNSSSEEEGEIHVSTKQGVLGENSDSAGISIRGFLGFGDKNDDVDEVEGKEEKISLVPENLLENDDYGGADVEKSAENGVVETRVEEIENFGGGNEQSTNYDTGKSLELETGEPGQGDTTVADMRPKASESGVTDYSSSLNQKASEEAEPKFFESETSIAAIGEAEGDERHVNPVEAGVVDEAGSKVSVCEENLVKDDAPGFRSIDSKAEIVREDIVESPEIVDSETKNSGDDLDQAHSSVISEGSIGEGEIAPRTDDGDLNSAEEVETHSGVSKEVVVGDERPTTGTALEKSVDDKVGEVNLSEIGEGSTALSEEIANEKVEVGSEHVSGPRHVEDEETSTESPPQASNIDELDGILNQEITSEHTAGHGEDEPELKLTADDGDLRSAEEEETPPVVPKETIVGDADKLLDQNFDEDKLVSGSENGSGIRDEEPAPKFAADGGDLNSAEEMENLPVVPKETIVGDENIEGTVNGSTGKLDSTSLNQVIGEDKLAFGSENVAGDGDDEPALKLSAHDGDLNSAEEVKTTPKETVVRDENINDATNESLPQNSDTDKLTSTGLKQASGRGEDEHAKETVAGDENLPRAPELGQKVEPDAGESRVGVAEEEKDEDEDGRISDGPAGVAILDGSEAAKQIIREMERISSSSQSGLRVDGQVASDSDEAVDSDEDGEGGELFDSAALAALLKAATSSSDGTVTVTAQDAARIFSVDRPVGLGTSAPSLRPAASRSTRPGLFPPSEIAAAEEPDRSMDDDEKILHEKVEQIRVKFLRLVHRLGHSPGDAVAGQVLYRLSLAEGIKQGRQMGRAFSIESAKKHALQLEEEGKDDLNFSCNIMVIGKTGVGKSATINSIFGEERSHTNPFQLATASVREICGVVDGVRVRVLDTPGLKPSIMDQATNRKILSSIKKFTKNCPPDIVLYVDRMDTQTRDFNDLPLLKSITSVLGSSIWFNAIVALTHAASAPPDGPNGTPLGYDVFVSQRSHIVQQSIRQAAGDMRLMNPVALVENHPSCRRNREGERILPNGLSWRPQLLLLSYASKILSEANSLLKLQDPSPGKLFGGFRLRSPPLPFLLSSLLQARAHPKLSGDQGGDNADSDVDLDEFSDAEQDEEVDEYDQLPPFKPLRKSQLAMLTKEQKRAYFDEYDYRVKLLQKKQWKEEIRRLKEAKKKGKDSSDEFPNSDMPEDYDQDSGPAAVQVPLPDMVLPPSFDCDNPAFRYRFLEPTSQFLTRPVLDTHGWDHDCGYDGVNIEESLAIAGRFPTSMAVQITKDKKEFNIHLDSSVAVKHGEHGSTVAGFDIQSVGKQLAYILRGETKFDSLKKNKTAAGVSVTFLGETVATGLKLEDRISIGKRLGLVASTGAVRAQGDVAYGANLEVRLKDKDYPVGQALSTLGLSLMKWRNDLALGANLQSQFPVGRNSKMAVRVGLNNKLTGQITVRTSTSDQLQIALTGIIPLAVYIYRSIKSNESYMDH